MWPARDMLTLLHAGSRKKGDIDAGGVLVGFTGVLVRDGYAGYDHFKDAAHAECGAHMLARAQGRPRGRPSRAAVGRVDDAHPADGQEDDGRGRRGGAGRRQLAESQVSFIRAAYAGAIAVGREANADHPGSKAAKLVERFARDSDEVLRFTTDSAIWFSNNQPPLFRLISGH